ncbi:MAG: hypothetical protein JJU36_16465 [Phycisphaeraceae bacterium]|nr:hypothetical protein [Phycisphaeraceae bacterium]
MRIRAIAQNQVHISVQTPGLLERVQPEHKQRIIELLGRSLGYEPVLVFEPPSEHDHPATTTPEPTIDELFQKARELPLIQAIFETFDNARLTDVRKEGSGRDQASDQEPTTEADMELPDPPTNELEQDDADWTDEGDDDDDVP